MDNTLWLSMQNGDLFRVAAGQQRAQAVANLPQINKLFVEASGRLWICTDFGIFTMSPGLRRVDRIALPNQVGQVSNVVQDAAGILWFATQGGLVEKSADRWVVLPLAPEAGGFIAVTPDDHGGLWAAGVSHGLMHLHVADTRIDRTEWIADHNVANASVIFTQMDSRGWLWLGTDKGLVLFDGHTWRKFDHQDGLIWNEVNQNAVFADTDGSMWIGTAAGLTHVLQPEKLAETLPLDLRLGSATLGKTLLGPDTQHGFQWKRDLALDVHLQQLDFTSPGKTVVKVRLRGLSDSWFETHEFNIHYPQLAPEQYTFEAIAIDHDHQRSSGLISVSFEVLPPWWETVWFKVVLAALLGLIIAGIWKRRAYKLEASRRELEQRLKEREELLDRATRDGLTRLWNRHTILEILTERMTCARRDGTALAVALIDIDHFKRVNDTMGHLVGDDVLRTLGTQLPPKMRACDSLGRYGGEELLLILPEAKQNQPILLIERLRQAIAEIPFSYNGSSFRVTASLGVAWVTSPSDTTEDIIARADEALYAAKGAGRDRVEYAATGTSL
jgi:diguanylate cyclase (GGDEF)-like protein